MMRISMTAALVILAVASTLALPAAVQAASAITVSDGWMRALPGDLPAGGYFKLHNAGGSPISLVGASSAACGTIMLHKSETMSGMAEMDEVQSIDVPPGATLTFSPGGYHLMCMNPHSLRPDSTIDVTLTFSNGTKVKSIFQVRNAAGR